MFCKKCGKEIDENAVVCIHCGGAVDDNLILVNKNSNSSKIWLGVVLEIFLGVVSLFIGFVLYPAESVARKTFIKGWFVVFIIKVVFIFFCGIMALILPPAYYV